MRTGPIFGYEKLTVLLGMHSGPRKGLCPFLESVPIPADHMSQYTASGLAKVEEMELGNLSSGQELLFGLVCDFAAKLGLWADQCLKKLQSP